MIRSTSIGTVLPIVLMTLAGCGSSTGPDDHAPIIPLRVGNFWTYEQQYFDSLSRVIYTDEETLRITETSVMDSETWYDTNQGYMMTLRPDGLWNYYQHSSPIHISQSARYPAAVGDTFSRQVFAVDGGRDSVEVCRLVMSTNHTVTIGQRSYSCMVYTSRYRRLSTGKKYADHELFDDDFIAFMTPNVGTVMTERFVKTSSEQIFLRNRERLIIRP